MCMYTRRAHPEVSPDEVYDLLHNHPSAVASPERMSFRVREWIYIMTVYTMFYVLFAEYMCRLDIPSIL